MKKKKNNLAQVFIIWIFLILMIFVLFMANLSKIRHVMQETDFVNIVFGGKTPQDEPQIQEEIPPDEVKFENPENEEPVEKPELTEQDLTLVTTEIEPFEFPKEEEEPAYETPVNTETLPESAETQIAKLYFVTIENDGSVVRRQTERQMLQTTAPLFGTMQSLLKGPNLSEVGKNWISLIPAKTQLLSAYIQGGTAFLNFNDAFQFNSYGAEGYQGQLMQVVFTATEFPSIKNVQILVEGQKLSYLGNDGAYIGKPLNRGSFAK